MRWRETSGGESSSLINKEEEVTLKRKPLRTGRVFSSTFDDADLGEGDIQRTVG